MSTTPSAIATWAAAEGLKLASIKAGITSLDALIQKFQNSPGTLSPADQAALDDIAAQSDALATAANTIPTPPGPPVAPPAPA